MNVPVIGNGQLGLVNLNTNSELKMQSTVYTSVSSSNALLNLNGTVNANSTPIGVSSDGTKSGLIAKISGLTIPSEKLGSFYIRY